MFSFFADLGVVVFFKPKMRSTEGGIVFLFFYLRKNKITLLLIIIPQVCKLLCTSFVKNKLQVYRAALY